MMSTTSDTVILAPLSPIFESPTIGLPTVSNNETLTTSVGSTMESLFTTTKILLEEVKGSKVTVFVPPIPETVGFNVKSFPAPNVASTPELESGVQTESASDDRFASVAK